MTASSSHAADRPGDREHQYGRRGFGQTRTAARFHERRERDNRRAIFPTDPFVSTRATGRASLKTETRARNPKVRLSARILRTASQLLPTGATPGRRAPALRSGLSISSEPFSERLVMAKPYPSKHMDFLDSVLLVATGECILWPYALSDRDALKRLEA